MRRAKIKQRENFKWHLIVLSVTHPCEQCSHIFTLLLLGAKCEQANEMAATAAKHKANTTPNPRWNPGLPAARFVLISHTLKTRCALVAVTRGGGRYWPFHAASSGPSPSGQWSDVSGSNHAIPPTSLVTCFLCPACKSITRPSLRRLLNLLTAAYINLFYKLTVSLSKLSFQCHRSFEWTEYL